MTRDPDDDQNEAWPLEAYRNPRFLASRDARSVRILSEFEEPKARFARYDISDTIVFFGSSKLLPRDEAENRLKAARQHGGVTPSGVPSPEVAAAERALAMSRYYEEARRLAARLTEWSKGLKDPTRRFVVCTGGGPGVMEAANRGASEAKGLNIGLNISIPHEQAANPHVTRELTFEFHYFFMRKFWFVYLAKAIVIFPGGFGTLDEFFEVLTLVQTRTLRKPMAIVLYGTPYWNEVMNLDAMVRHGTLEPADLELFKATDSVDDAFAYIIGKLEDVLPLPGASL
ncbi:MAG: TIGR00730 family Rossman fold protein [Rhodospirillales bacterium]|nr:TIGR00730 family Rossman fold protein [Rhodospirillales bacterium]